MLINVTNFMFVANKFITAYIIDMFIRKENDSFS